MYKFIDEGLIKRAESPSEVITQIDTSWRNYAESLSESINHLPFPGVYNAKVTEDDILVEGYNGQLVINKVYGGGKTYALTKSIVEYPFRIYGRYDKKGTFEDFAAEPGVGAHFIGGSFDKSRTICSGELIYQSHHSIEELEKICKKIVESMKLINLESLGEIILPNSHRRLRKCLKAKELTAEKKIKMMLRYKVIREIL